METTLLTRRQVETPFRYRHKKEVKPIVSLTDTEAQELIQAAGEIELRGVPSGRERNQAIVTLALHAGLRVGEIHKLNCQDVTLTPREDAAVTVWHGKRNKMRTIGLTYEAAETIERYLLTRDDDEDALFLSRRGTRMGVSSLKWLIQQIANRAGIEKWVEGRKIEVTPHKLRHTFGTIHAQRGTPESVIQAMMGHSKREITQRYFHVVAGRGDVQRISQPISDLEQRQTKIEKVVDEILMILKEKL